MSAVLLRPLIENHPKAMPLAKTLVAAAAEQGANAGELELACRLAIEAYRKARDNSGMELSHFESEAKAALDSI
ncbi:hypothetical protein [uncultured Dysosmobacter sp.]|uniref:hypothetical protein n=1 Tax=uncultured Dysosmobacter sp. TaxID=2591384 RepID=UPI00261939E5|nr:hypothetical protein [uncultured Dysosmobacter sp.]